MIVCLPVTCIEFSRTVKVVLTTLLPCSYIESSLSSVYSFQLFFCSEVPEYYNYLPIPSPKKTKTNETIEKNHQSSQFFTTIMQYITLTFPLGTFLLLWLNKPWWRQFSQDWNYFCPNFPLPVFCRMSWRNSILFGLYKNDLQLIGEDTPSRRALVYYFKFTIYIFYN